MPLSNPKIQTSKPTDTPYKLADEKGLFLLIHPTIGIYPDIGLADAREKIEEARKQIANGADPGMVKQFNKAGVKMEKETVTLNGMHLVGISIRTNNQNEMNLETAKIGKLLDQYWGEQIANGIKDRVNAPVTYAVYTEYDSDEHGDYTYFLGEEVSLLERQDSETLQSMFIPAGAYQKFTTEPGKFPDVVIGAWQKIWQMKEADFGGKREYLADFEVYDQRARDPSHAVVDIYIGIKEASK